jgi:thiamine kinase-like enzyme
MNNLLKATIKTGPNTILHMDLVRGNILFIKNSSEIAGVIDFEKVAYGNITFDIARTLAFLMVDCKYKSYDKIYKYFIKSGYNKYGNNGYVPIIINTKQSKFYLLDELVKFYLLYDLYKFLKHNPYEYLNNNHHFIRTRDILLEKRILV